MSQIAGLLATLHNSFYRQVYSGLAPVPLMAIFTMIFIACRKVVFACFASYAERCVAGGGLTTIHSQVAMNDKNEQGRKRILEAKFLKYLWHATAYSAMEIWGILLSFQASWSFFNTGSFDGVAIGWPHTNDVKQDADTLHAIWLFLMVQTSWYLAGAVEMILHDRNRGDFWLMMMHHVVAICLIYGAFAGDAHRVAVTVCITLDITDVVMYCAKMYHLSTSTPDGKALNARCNAGQTRALAIVGVAWVLTRILAFAAEVWAMWAHNAFATTALIGNILKVQLAVMLVLQTIWGVLIWKMVISQYLTGEFEDNCSGDLHAKKSK